MFRVKYLFLMLMLAFPVVMNIDAHAQSASSIAKLAKDFNVSPKLLTKFSKAGLSGADLGNGLKIAKEAVGTGSLKIDDAVERVLSLKQGGKNWPDIATELGVDLPQGIDTEVPAS